MPEPTLRAVAFDWGGIFTEGTFDAGAVTDLAALTGAPEDEIARSYYPLMAEFEAGAFDFPAFHQRFVARSGLDMPAAAFRETFLGSVRERAAMYQVLAAIPPRYTVGMLSNNVPVLCDRVRRDARMGRVEHFVFSNEIGVRKPDPRAFARLSEALGQPPEATVFVDDNPDNVEACRRLGYRGILLDTFEAFKVEWQKLLPDVSLAAVR